MEEAVTAVELAQPAARVEFRMIGKAMQCELAFEEGVEFNPANPSHLLGWYVQVAAGDLLPIAAAAFRNATQNVAAQLQEKPNEG